MTPRAITRSGQTASRLKLAEDAARAAPEPPEREPGTARERLEDVRKGSLGVVFVHGIGAQPRGGTLLDWAGPLVRAISGWGRNTDGVVWDPDAGTDAVIRAEIDFDGGNVPYVIVDVPGRLAGPGYEQVDGETWVMTEAWWAQRVEPPPLSTMIDWCGRQGVVARVVERILAHLGGSSNRLLDALAKIGFGLFVSTVCTILLLAYTTARALAGVIPIAAIQNALTNSQLDTLLTRWWGEVYLLVSDPIQSANIRSRLNDTIGALRAFGCDRIAVVAHSGGTIVSYMALSDPASETSADSLITLGEAIGMGRFISSEPRLSEQTLRVGGQQPGRWTDFWATHDPAPCGPLAPEFTSPGDGAGDGRIDRPVTIWNRRSLLDDHGTYWTNDEEFIYGVLAELDVAGKSRDATSRFTPPTLPDGDSWVSRRRQRVAMLTMLVRTVFVIPLLAAVAAFVTGNVDSIRSLANAVFGAVGAVPGVPGLVESLHATRLQSPLHEIVHALGIITIAVLVLAALVHAALPIGQARIWPERSWQRAGFWFLDSSPALVVLGIAALGVYSFIRWFAGHQFDLGTLVSIAVAGLVALALIAFFAAPNSRGAEAIHAGARGHPAFSAAMLLGVSVLIVGCVAYALIVEEPLRTWTVGTFAALAVFQLVGRVGKWRWRVWDDREREAFRSRAATAPDRRWAFVQIAMVATILGLAGATLLVGSSLTVGATVSALVLVVVVFVLRDAALRAMT